MYVNLFPLDFIKEDQGLIKCFQEGQRLVKEIRAILRFVHWGYIKAKRTKARDRPRRALKQEKLVPSSFHDNHKAC